MTKLHVVLTFSSFNFLTYSTNIYKTMMTRTIVYRRGLKSKQLTIIIKCATTSSNNSLAPFVKDKNKIIMLIKICDRITHCELIKPPFPPFFFTSKVLLLGFIPFLLTHSLTHSSPKSL